MIYTNNCKIFANILNNKLIYIKKLNFIEKGHSKLVGKKGNQNLGKANE